MRRVIHGTFTRLLVRAAVGGFIFGAAASLANAFGGPFVAQFLGMGWAWAAVGVAVGWLAPTRRTAWIGATLALLAAVVAYYASDLALGVYETIDRSDPVPVRTTTDWFAALADLAFWVLRALIAGPLLGLIGHATHVRGIRGLPAELFVPAMMVANVAMVVTPLVPRHPASLAAHVVIGCAALAWGGWAVTRRVVSARA